MMKNIFSMASKFVKMAAIAAVAVFSAACQEEDPPFIFLSQESVVAGPEVASYKIEVKSNVSWTVTSNADWARVFGENGNYKGNFEVLLDENNSAGTRNCEVVVEGAGCTSVLSIVQTFGEVALVVPVTDYTLSKEAANLEIKYVVSTEEAAIDALPNTDWIVVKSADKGVVKAEVAENETGEARTGIIKIVATDKKGNATVCETNIHQAATENILDVLVDSLKIDAAGETIRIPLVTNTEINAECTSEWCKVSVDKSTIVVTAASNDSGELRETYLLVTTASSKGDILSKKIFVTQAAVVVPDDELTVPVAEIAFEGEAGSILVPFTTDSQVSVKTSSTWLKAKVIDSDVEVSVEENTTDQLRKGYVTLTTTDGTVGVITVSQAPIIVPDDSLELPVSELNFDGEAETIKVPFVSDAEVTVKSSSAWLKAEVKDTDVEVSVEENATSKLRTGYVTVTTTDGTVGIITVNQAPIVVNSDELTILVSELRVLSGAEKHIIPFASNTTVTARSNKEWCKVSVVDLDVVADVAANTGDEREAYITLTTKTGVSGVIHLYQNAPDVDETTDDVTVLVDEVEFGGDAGSINVPFTAETEVTVRTSSEWLTAEVVGGDVKISVVENWSGATRKGYVTLQTTDLCAAVITVIQESNTPEFSFSNEEVNVGPAASENYIMVTSTGDWKLTNTEDQIPGWLTVTPTEGSDGETMVTLSVKANKFAVERTATLFFQNTEFGMKVNVAVNQAENPSGISNYMHLGKGYDVSGNYAEDSFVKNSVLDCDALAKGDCIADLISTNQTTETTIRGTNLEEYEKNYAVAAGLSGEYAGFTGSVKTNFSEKALGSAEHSYVTFRHVTKKQILKVNENETAATLMDYRTESFLKDIDKLTADALVAKYGTHVIMGFSIGGVIDYSMAADVSSMGTEINLEVAVEAGFEKEAVGKINTEDSYNQFSSMKSNSTAFESKLLCRGGESQYTSSGFSTDAQAASAYESWLTSLEDSSKWVLVDYEGTDGSQLIPLWDFIETTNAKHDAVMAVAKAKLNNTGITQTSSYKTFEMKLTGLQYYGASGIPMSALAAKVVNATVNGGDKIHLITNDNCVSVLGDYPAVGDGAEKSYARTYSFPQTVTTGTHKLSKFKDHAVVLSLEDGMVADMDGASTKSLVSFADTPIKFTISYVVAAGKWTYRDVNNIDHEFVEDANGKARAVLEIPGVHCALVAEITMK